jgi:DNA-binding beta-propeller fold protein YncE
MRSLQRLSLSLVITAILLFPGCGGSHSAPVTPVNPVQPPTALSYSADIATYTVGMAITPNNPSSAGGAITAYAVAPDLPAGLTLSTNTGVISGTPTAVATANSYVVTASNDAGSTTDSVTITVNAAPPAAPKLAYSAPAPVYALGVATTQNAPTTSPSAGTVFSVTPALPAGLVLDQATGILTGTPSAASSPTASPNTATYKVTATNSAGSATAPLTITLYNASQSVPNMNQSITPLAATGSGYQFLDTGMVITDPANSQIPAVEWLAGQAVSSSVSPDGTTLLVLTSGYNRVFQAPFPLFAPQYSNEYVFIFDITSHTPVFEQAVPIPNAYHGLVWDPIAANHAFYVSGGLGDAPYGTDPVPYPKPNNGDNVHIIVQNQTTHVWSQAAELDLGQNPNAPQVGHPSGNGLPVPNNQFASVNSAVFVAPCAAGVAISNDGQVLVVANYENDSITVFTGGLSAWVQQWQSSTTSAQQAAGTLHGFELDLRPGKAATSPAQGLAGGEYPFWVVIAGDGSQATPYTAYVSSLRDREIDVVSLAATPAVKVRIPVKGQPNKMTLNHLDHSQPPTLLYVAEDESDTVSVIDINPAHSGTPTTSPTVNTVIESIPVIAPASVMSSYSLTQYTGANTNSVTLSSDETRLFVTNGNLNNIAVVALTGTNTGDHVTGLIPTGWYPNSVSLSADGTWAYVVNAKSPTGANPQWCYNYGPSGYPACAAVNQYNPQLTKAGLLSFPIASAIAQLPSLTTQVVANNRFANTSNPGAVMAAVHAGIHHVIYILRENRTYDQILGDLNRGNGDPSLALFGQPITPNAHALASTFVTLDNFRDTAEVSNDGWPWSTSARAPDVVEHQYPVYYAQRGLALETEGTNRSVNVALPTLAERQAANPLMPGGALSPDVQDGEDLLPGQTDVDAPDGPNNEINTGYIWDAALRAGLTVRSYGFFVDTTCYNEPPCQVPLMHDPYASGTVVGHSTNVSLSRFTDPYFRGFDPAFPDFYRFKEWERDFDANYASGGLPTLSLVRFMHDHTGSFGTAIDNVNTPDRDVADNDYAVGLLIQKIANSIYANDTLIFIVEDDAQDGGDHVDSHRSPAFIIGPYVKRNQLVSTSYTTIDFLRTMEEVLGLEPMNLNDALANPMADIFDSSPSAWTFTATPAAILYCTNLPLPAPAQPCTNPTPDAKYWARVTAGMDFNDADRVDGGVFNRILWKGLMGDKPYPAAPTGADLRQNREKLLAIYHESQKPLSVVTTQVKTTRTRKP